MKVFCYLHDVSAVNFGKNKGRHYLRASYIGATTRCSKPITLFTYVPTKKRVAFDRIREAILHKCPKVIDTPPDEITFQAPAYPKELLEKLKP